MAARPEKPSIKSVIEACSMFRALNEEVCRQITEHASMAYAERGEAIWLAGSPSHFIAVVGAGFVKMTRTTPQGSEVAIELIGPGQCFGVLVALEGREYPLSALAVTNTWFLKVPSPALLDAYAKDPGLRDAILKALGPRLRRAHDMMARLSTGRVEQRIAAVLLILMDSYGEEMAVGNRIEVPLTRQDLSEMAGTTVETTIRVMSRLQKEGVISTDNRMITILRPVSLSDSLLV